jgi:hypothetical protein
MVQLVGRKPEKPVPRTEDFEALERRMIDILIDSTKYVATVCGIVIGIYSRVVQDYLGSANLVGGAIARLLLFSPLLLWFVALLGSVAAIFPRIYRADSDLEKQEAVRKIRLSKVRWLRLVLCFFLGGFAVFGFVISGQIWGHYPFR